MARKSNRKAVAAAPVADVEAISKPGLGIDEGIVFTTFFVLALAIVCVVMANGHYAP